MDDHTIAAEVDTTGLLCPLPVLKARKRLGDMAPGAVLRMVADDPAALVDVPHFCTEQGHTLITQEEAPGGALVFLIRKGG
ncbi:MAG: sulfurtransferase TusA family protein [Pseudomonadota bacterium]